MYQTIIGMEVHAELSTKSKMFCNCPADHFGVKPNTQTCPVCLGLPGAMPFVNKKAIEDTVLFGLAMNCQINKKSKFDRKHYFYPDLPKSFQISQYDLPLCVDGYWQNEAGKKFRIKRIHLEEDTAKLIHEGEDSLIDFNRSSVPLMELVTEPDFNDPKDVDSFLKYLQTVLRYLGISTADMEKGSLRLEANISVASENEVKEGRLPDYKVELKNINSFKFLIGAIQAEIKRQTEARQKGEILVQETRGFNPFTGETFSQRIKEEAKDYRYFPEPDLPPITFSDEEIKNLKAKLPEMPNEKISRYQELGVPLNFAEIIAGSPSLSSIFDLNLDHLKGEFSAKTLADYIVNKKIEIDEENPLSISKRLKEVFGQDKIGLKETEVVVARVLAKNMDVVQKYKDGKVTVIGFLVGQVQKELKGKADPKLAQETIINKIEAL